MIPYTIVRNKLSDMLDIMSVDFCDIMDNNEITAVPVGTIGPTVRDKKTGRSRGIVSLKHAAVLAGLGYMGRNTLLITPEYGNMVWLTAVLTDLELDPDETIDDRCPEDCYLCIENCPANALKKDSLEMDQGACWNHAFRTNEGENFYIKCHKCRTICPRCLGNKNEQ